MATLQEHEPIQKDLSEGDNYQPTDEEKATIALGEKLFDKNKRFKSKYDEKWNDWYGMFRGRQWKENRPSYRHSEVVNLIFREIQSGVPIQMDARPKFEYLPQEPSDIEFSEIMNQVAEADWTRRNWSDQLTEMVFDSWILGTGVGSMPFDPKADKGKGAIVFRSADPFYQFPSPNARDVNIDNCVHIEVEPMGLDEIKKKYKNGKYVTADVGDLKRMDLFDKERVKFSSALAGTVTADKNQQVAGQDAPEALVVTVYIRADYEINEEKTEKSDESGAIITSYVQKAKYPNGRRLIFASKVLLDDGPNPYEDELFPFVRVQNYVNQRQFWGISDIEQLESPQKVFNKLVCFALDVLTLMGNPVWIVGSGSGVDTENLFNQPGLIIEPTDINQVRREEGVSLQPFVLQLIDRMKSWFDDVSGSLDVSRGANPEGVTAASAIQSLQEAAQTRIRQKSRNLDSTLQNLGQLYLNRVLQFYTAPQIFRLTNQDGSMKFFKFHIENTPDGKKMANYMPFQENADGGFVDGQPKQIPVSGTLDLKVSTGSNLSFAKDAAKNEALQLFDRQAIDREELLKRFDYPNLEAVLQRLSEADAQAQQMQAAGQGPPQAQA